MTHNFVVTIIVYLLKYNCCNTVKLASHYGTNFVERSV